MTNSSTSGQGARTAAQSRTRRARPARVAPALALSAVLTAVLVTAAAFDAAPPATADAPAGPAAAGTTGPAATSSPNPVATAERVDRAVSPPAVPVRDSATAEAVTGQDHGHDHGQVQAKPDVEEHGHAAPAGPVPATAPTAAPPTPTGPAGPVTTPDAQPVTTPDAQPVTTPDAQPVTTPDAQPVTTDAPGGATVAAPGVVSGTLTRIWAEELAPGPDHAHAHALDEHAAQLGAWLETEDTAYPIVADDVADVEVHATLTVELGPATGDGEHPVLRRLDVEAPVLAAGEVGYGEGSSDLFGIAAAGVLHDVTVVLANPRGATRDGTTAAAVAATVNGGVNNFWSSQTRGQRGVRVVAQHGWIDLAADCSTPSTLWNEVASRVKFTSGTRKHLLVYLPRTSGCGAGLGTVGGPDTGGRSWVTSNSTSLIAHELGHNMGLGHSDGLLCDGRADGTFSAGRWQSGCASHGYRDYYDVMGISWSHLGSLAGPQADLLGVLRSTEMMTVSTPTRVHLVPGTSDGLRVLRVDDPSGVYYVEYRVATGWDSWLSSNWRGLEAGVIVHRKHPSSTGRAVLLLDGSVAGGDRTVDWRSALRPGTSLTTASGSTRISVEQQSSTSATVVVHRDGIGPDQVTPPPGGAQVQVTAPALRGRAGSTVFSGVATAPEGTLRWEVLQDGARRASGYTATGANGTFDTFQVPVNLPAGTFTFRAWIPDDSDGESTTDPRLLLSERTVTLS